MNKVPASKRFASRNAFTKAGLPLVIFIVAGSYGLSIFMQTHYEYKDKKAKSSTTRVFNLEEEHRKTMEKLNIKEYNLSRIPRPGEEGGNSKKQNGEDNNKASKRTWISWWNGSSS